MSDRITLSNELLATIGSIADEQRLEAYVVGGYVRDHLLGLGDKDIDIVVSRQDLARATPQVTFEVTCRFEG